MVGAGKLRRGLGVLADGYLFLLLTKQGLVVGFRPGHRQRGQAKKRQARYPSPPKTSSGQCKA